MEHVTHASDKNRGDENTEERFDNDGIEDRDHYTDAGHTASAARMERALKYAAWRTEMVRRQRGNGHLPARPESSF